VVAYCIGERGRPFATPEAMPHISDDSLEQYTMGTLPEPDLNLVEEHLLICEECQDRLKATDAYVVAMRSALKKHGKREAKDSGVFSQAALDCLPRSNDSRRFDITVRESPSATVILLNSKRYLVANRSVPAQPSFVGAPHFGRSVA